MEGQWKGFHTAFFPSHTCISEPLDKPRALASSVVKPFLSVLLTVQTEKRGLFKCLHGSPLHFSVHENKWCQLGNIWDDSHDFRLTRDRLLSRGCVRWLGPWVADLTILSMISSAVSSVQFTGSSLAEHHGATRPETERSEGKIGQVFRNQSTSSSLYR